QAAAETFSKMRWPSSPGKGGRSRPGMSRPNLTQWTIRAMSCTVLQDIGHSHTTGAHTSCRPRAPALSSVFSIQILGGHPLARAVLRHGGALLARAACRAPGGGA